MNAQDLAEYYADAPRLFHAESRRSAATDDEDFPVKGASELLKPDAARIAALMNFYGLKKDDAVREVKVVIPRGLIPRVAARVPEITEMILAGKSAYAVAKITGFSESTIRKVRQSILKKEH